MKKLLLLALAALAAALVIPAAFAGNGPAPKACSTRANFAAIAWRLLSKIAGSPVVSRPHNSLRIVDPNSIHARCCARSSGSSEPTSR